MLPQQAASAPWPSGSWNTPHTAAAAARPRGARDERWYAIWCHEKVHKPRCLACRTLVRECLETSQGHLVCLKKPIKFEEYMKRELRYIRRGEKPYVLITDWREAKPCMTTLELFPDSPPELFAIICESKKQASRARDWLDTLSKARTPPMCVIDATELVEKETQEAPMTCAPQHTCSCMAGLCQHLTEAVLQAHRLAPAVLDVLQKREMKLHLSRTPSSTFAACCERPPLLSTGVRESAHSLAAKCHSDTRVIAQGEAEMLRGHEAAPSDRIFAKEEMMRSQPGARPCLALVDVAARPTDSPSSEGTGSIPQSSWPNSASPVAFIDEIVKKYSQEDIAAMLCDSGNEFYED